MLGDSEIETILKRMDRLTQEEARMTMAQTLAVVHGLLNNAKVVMDGDPQWAFYNVIQFSLKNLANQIL